jgi:ATP-binding cassette subfamily F protein 3
LLEALQKFSGTIVFVSHDRYFIDNLATRVFEIGGGEVHDFRGNYEDYLWSKEGKQIDLSLDFARPAAVEEPEPEPEPVKAVPGKRVNPIKMQQMKDRCGEIEEQIARLEAEIAEYESELAEFVSAEQTLKTTNLMDQRRAESEKLMAEWEQLSKEVEEVG